MDIASLKGEKEFDEILKTISLRLKHYEDTGLTPQEIMELKERDTGVKPIFLDEWDMCGNCGEHLMPDDSFCSECGQRIRW